jgi:hypothetical protein
MLHVLRVIYSDAKLSNTHATISWCRIREGEVIESVDFGHVIRFDLPLDSDICTAILDGYTAREDLQCELPTAANYMSRSSWGYRSLYAFRIKGDSLSLVSIRSYASRLPSALRWSVEANALWLTDAANLYERYVPLEGPREQDWTV